MLSEMKVFTSAEDVRMEMNRKMLKMDDFQQKM